MADLAVAKKVTKVQKDEQVQQTEPKFTKEQIVAAKRFHHQRDLVTAVLDDDKQYTMTEVETLMEKYMKGKVK